MVRVVRKPGVARSGGRASQTPASRGVLRTFRERASWPKSVGRPVHLQVTRSTSIEIGLRPGCVAACKRGTRNSCAAPSVRPSLAMTASRRLQGSVRVLRASQQACFARRTAETAFWHWPRSILRHWRRAISSQSVPCSPIVYLTNGDEVKDRTRRSSYRLPKPPVADSKSPTRLTHAHRCTVIAARMLSADGPRFRSLVGGAQLSGFEAGRATNGKRGVRASPPGLPDPRASTQPGE